MMLVAWVGGMPPAAADGRRGEWQLWAIEADGTNLRRFSESPGYNCGSPDWSPDGKLVAFDTWEVGLGFDASELAVVRADGTGRRVLGPGAMPSWSPDGTQLVCHTYDSPQTIVVMNADGTGRETIVHHWGSPRWSPRGNRIASIFSGSIALFDCASGEERVVVTGPFYARQGFGISPDGRHFCFGNQQTGVCVATIDETARRATNVRWPLKTGTCYHASWSPNAKRIVIGWREDNRDNHQLYLLDVETGESTWLAGQDRERHNTNPDWSPDGKTIVFASQLPLPGQLVP
jgi:Tol biopolymer transport system component